MNTSFLTRSILSSAVAMAAAVLFAPSAAADNSPLNSKDKSFLESVYQDGLAEVHDAQMAEQKTTNPDVKAFAERMVTDHTAANKELKALADTKKVSLASEPSLAARGEHKALDMKSGSNFDKTYIDDQVEDHKKAVEAFEKAASQGQDADVEALANKILPTLKSHLSMAESVQQKIGK